MSCVPAARSIPAFSRMADTALSLADGFLAPSVMNELVVWLLSDASDGVSGRRFNASLWDDSKHEDEAARAAMLPYPEEPHLF